MTVPRELNDRDLRAAVEAAAHGMVDVRHLGDASFVSLPLHGPDGAPVTVHITRGITRFRLDDGGATHRALERLGLGRSFSSAASRVLTRGDLSVTGNMIIGYADEDDLDRAIVDVGMAAWSVLDRVYRNIDGEAEEELELTLRQRLTAIFGPSSLGDCRKIAGASCTEWEVSAVLRVGDQLAVFQAVSEHANSVYRASAAFHDLASLPAAPSLVAVVKSKEELGSRLGILSQIAHVIEEAQPDEAYRRAVG
jgi:hypothetical protein